MPTKTFLRLPEEKQARFMDAAWAEFTRVSYADTSISNIVKVAGISRGSFYQYFTDKDDLFSYLMEEVRRHFTSSYLGLLEAVRGDLFQVHLAAYDRFVQQNSNPPPLVDRVIRLLRINPGLDFQKITMKNPDTLLLEDLYSHLDISRFRKKDPAFVQQVLSLSIFSLGSAIMYTLVHPESRDACREELAFRLDIIQHGAMDQSAPVNP